MSSTTASDVRTISERVKCDVAIVGYGPVGMVLSGLLARQGFDVAVVERHAELYPLARAGHYDGETMRTFQELGVADAVELAAQPMLLWNLVTAEKEILATIHIGEGGAGWKESYLSYQPEIEHILDARARELGVRVFNGFAAVAIEQTTDRASVVCHPVEDSTSEATVIEAAYVIGADGADSFVRSALGIERARLGFAPMDSLVIDFKLHDPDRELATLPEVMQVLDMARPLLAGRWEGRNYTRFEFILQPEEDWEQIASERSCWELLAKWDLTPDDGEIARGVVYRFEATLVPQWRDERVLLIGDAAHTMPPTMGQGLCSGIRDAENLVWKLAAVLRGDAAPELLDTVHSERSPHARRLIEMCVGLGEMWNTRDPEAARRRDEMLRMGNVPPAPVFPRLGPGVVTPEEDGGRVADGRPSPQARVARNGRVARLDEFGHGWKVVSRHAAPDDLFTKRQQNVLEELEVEFAHVSRGPGPDYYVDIDGEYDLWFRRHGVRAFIQRPDKYVFGTVAELHELPALVDELAHSIASAGWTFRNVSLDEPGQPGHAETNGRLAAKRGPYPGPVDVRFATDDAAQFLTSFFTAKTRRQIQETHAHFHPDQTYYADATLGWQFPTNEKLEDVWKQYMPFWGDQAKSYPIQILGDIGGAAVVMTDTPELFGGEIRGIAIVDFLDNRIVRWIDYWDGREFGLDAVTKMRMSQEKYPEDLGVGTVDARQAPELGAAVEGLIAAIGSGREAELGKLLAYDASLEDFALRTKVRGRSAIGRYLGRAAGRLPYQAAKVRHIVGSERAGGFEWTAASNEVPRGAAGVTLDDDGAINALSICWDGSLLSDDQLVELVALSVEPRR